MQDERWDRIREVFDEVARHPPDERRRVLVDLCPDDADLQNEVLSLLEHDERAEPHFLKPPTPTVAESEADGPDWLIGKRIGQFTIRRLIAQSGMGSVYEAQQAHPQRLVAIKVVCTWAWSAMGRRRFEFEVQTLARLLHPHIAQIYDAGTWDGEAEKRGRGLPYFAMELVPDARSITNFAAGKKLDLRGRLELILQVCDAVQYGHQKGIIHRDLKPANILVDPAGRVKVIDFGVAKATDSDVAATTMRTDAGQLVGTLNYMSPEQCAADPLGLDVRSDVYSLGVVLYELLCNKLPYTLPTSLPNLTQVIRVICEQPPDRPSAADRSLRGDLEIILLKALEKDREKRYQSVADWSRDIRHYINREPIEARKPSKSELVRNWIKRYPLAATTVSATCIGLLILAGGLWIGNKAANFRLREVEAEIARLNERPDRVERSDDKKEVIVRSRTGRPLYTWRSEVKEWSLAFSDDFTMVDDPALQGMAIIGFPPKQSKFGGSWCAFDVANGRFEVPAWCSRIEDSDLPLTSEFRNKETGFTALDFGPGSVWVTDIFSEEPGNEIALTYTHVYSRRAFRVYSIDGRLLYQKWYRGDIHSVYWLEKANLLVISGTNCEGYWRDRGVPGITNPRPLVAFAFRPTKGLRSREFLEPRSSDGVDNPLWYWCLLPPTSSDVFSESRLRRPAPGWDDGKHVSYLLTYRAESGLRADSLIRDNGTFIPEGGVQNDVYNLRSDLPRIHKFYFGPLPSLNADQLSGEEPVDAGD